MPLEGCGAPVTSALMSIVCSIAFKTTRALCRHPHQTIAARLHCSPGRKGQDQGGPGQHRLQTARVFIHTCIPQMLMPTVEGLSLGRHKELSRVSRQKVSQIQRVPTNQRFPEDQLGELRDLLGLFTGSPVAPHTQEAHPEHEKPRHYIPEDLLLTGRGRPS